MNPFLFWLAPFALLRPTHDQRVAFYSQHVDAQSFLLALPATIEGVANTSGC
jgi:hypothetical protein